MSDPIRARLTGPATRFAYLLRDFGHLDDKGLAELFLAAAAEAEQEGPEATVDLPEIRRIAARLLFASGGPELGEGQGILAEDWPLLFS